GSQGDYLLNLFEPGDLMWHTSLFRHLHKTEPKGDSHADNGPNVQTRRRTLRDPDIGRNRRTTDDLGNRRQLLSGAASSKSWASSPAYGQTTDQACCAQPLQ